MSLSVKFSLLRSLSAIVLLVLAGCTPPGTTGPVTPAEPFVPTLSLRPVAVSLNRRNSQSFQAELNFVEGTRYLRQPVLWSVLEADGGSLTQAGLYTAPDTPGTYHVRIRREDFPEVVATATVTVK